MTHPSKTREGGATVTVFVPYDCRNHCPFCVNKQEYAHAEGFSVEAILKSIAVMDGITPHCDFVFTGGEPFADLDALQRMLDAVPKTHKVYINTTFPVQPGCSAEEMIAFTERNRDKITCINVSRHLTKYVEESPDEVVAKIATKKRVNCVLYMDYPADELEEYAERRENGVSLAWLHHKGRNRHHFEYWIDYCIGDDGKVYMGGCKMPLKYVAEMFCDRIAACKVYQGEKYTDASAYDYYARSRGHIMIHPETGAQIEKMLLVLKEEGEEKAFAYVRGLLAQERKANAK